MFWIGADHTGTTAVALINRLLSAQTAKRGACTPEVRLDFFECTPGLRLDISIARLAPAAGAMKNTTTKKYLSDKHNFQQSH